MNRRALFSVSCFSLVTTSMSCAIRGDADDIAAAFHIPNEGARIDRLGPGAALQFIARLGAALAVVFSALWLYFRSRGGYRVVELVQDVSSRH